MTTQIEKDLIQARANWKKSLQREEEAEIELNLAKKAQDEDGRAVGRAYSAFQEEGLKRIEELERG